MNEVHLVLGIAVLGTNALAAAWGSVSYLRREPSVVFWYLLRTAQATVVVEVMLGAILLLGPGGRPADELHYVYGLAPLLVTFVTEGMRAGAAGRELQEVEDVEALEERDQVALARRVVLRETGILTVGALLILTLALRAMTTGER